jgi:hypothetical protein
VKQGALYSVRVYLLEEVELDSQGESRIVDELQVRRVSGEYSRSYEKSANVSCQHSEGEDIKGPLRARYRRAKTECKEKIVMTRGVLNKTV